VIFKLFRKLFRPGPAILVLAFGCGCYWLVLHRPTQGWGHFVPAADNPGPAEISTSSVFLYSRNDAEHRYRALFDYFLAGALRYTDTSGSRIHFPGASSLRGYDITGLEGFARTATLFAAWIASGRDPRIPSVGARPSVDLVDYLRRGLLAGTDPSSSAYWGNITDYDQRIVEAADIARVVWMTRAQIWQHLSYHQQSQISNWLLQVGARKTPDNNWLLFPATVEAVMRSLGRSSADPSVNYLRFKQYYLGDGWFFDKPEGVDYYNTWSISYELLWLTLIDPAFDRDFIRATLRDSAHLTAHLIGPSGVPIMGRSICYRTAISVPLIAESMLDPDSLAPGLARRSMDTLWRHFVARGSLQDGSLTQGFYRADLRYVDEYTGPGSCNWGLRSLVLAYLNAPDSAFWIDREEPLPVEVADFHIAYEKLGWIVSGNHSDGDITIEIPRNAGFDPTPEPYTWWDRLLEHVLRRPMRPENKAMKYDRHVYSAREPFTEG
jgi:hypothetical protein